MNFKFEKAIFRESAARRSCEHGGDQKSRLELAIRMATSEQRKRRP